MQSIDIGKQQLCQLTVVSFGLLCWSSLTDFLSAPHVLCGGPMTLPFGAKFDLLISFEFQAKVSKHLKVPLSDSFSDHTRAGYLNVLEAIIWECFFWSRLARSLRPTATSLLINTTNVTCLGPSNDPMWEDSKSIYVGVTAASPFNNFITRFRATLLVHMRSEQRWRLNLKCSTATRIMRKSFALERRLTTLALSPSWTILLSSPSLRESGGLRSGLRQRLFWLSSVWVQAHTDFVNQLPTNSVLSWDQEKEVCGVPGNSWVRRHTE